MITGIATQMHVDTKSFRNTYGLRIPDNLKDEYVNNQLYDVDNSKDQDYVDWWKDVIDFINNLDTVDTSIVIGIVIR